MTTLTALDDVYGFLGCPTPVEWLQEALHQRDTVLLDHANCEKKAAATAVNLLFRYADRHELMGMMSRLAREELLHFEQVTERLDRLGVKPQTLSAGRYASGLRELVATSEPERLVDTLIAGAFIEARSCERFSALARAVKGQPDWSDLARYYRFLLKSESRHFADYLALAKLYWPYGDASFEKRVALFREREQALVMSPDPVFRFHSGVPAEAA